MRSFTDNKHSYINGQKFVLLADKIFIANLPVNEFKKISCKNYKVLKENNNLVTFKSKNLNLSSGDIVYCSANHVELFFHYLKQHKNLKHIILISGQSDRSINRTVFKKMPNNIIKWYSTNIDYKHKKLIPIPLGIANDYSPKNIREKDFSKFNNKSHDKSENLYINLQKNTNSSERNNVYQLFNNENWVTKKEPNLNIFQYMEDLSKYKFVLCPWGNGIDTHRLWESLYLGSIPVTKSHITYNSVSNLPIIFVENFEDITLDYLKEYLKRLDQNNQEELDFAFWANKIIASKEKFDETNIQILEKPIYEFFYWNIRKIKNKIKSKIKIIKYYLSKITKFFLNI